MRQSLPLITGTLLALLDQGPAAVAAFPTHHQPQSGPPSCQPGEWVELAPLPIPRQEHATIAIDSNTIGVLGGTIPTGYIHSPGGPGGNTTITLPITETTNLFHLYDIPTNTWRPAAPAPKKLNHLNAAVLDGKVYLLGGLEDGPGSGSEESGFIPNWLAFGGCYVYDVASDTWEELPSSSAMPTGMERGSAAIGVHAKEKMIYLAGGMTILSTYQNTVNTVIGFNVTSREWQYMGSATEGAELPEGRQHVVGGVTEDDKFYVIGGRTYGQEMTRDTVFVLDLAAEGSGGGWKEEEGAKLSVPRGGLSGAVVGGRDFYTFGGEGDTESETGVFDQVEVLRTGEGKVKDRMVELSPMALPRHGTQAAAVGDRVYIPGGGLQQDGKAVVMANGTVSYGNPTARFQAYCV